jgi:hypothetical protein
VLQSPIGSIYGRGIYGNKFSDSGQGGQDKKINTGGRIIEISAADVRSD